MKIYPTTVKTTTGRSTKAGTQMLSNPQALCSNNTFLAYYGTKFGDNWADTLNAMSNPYNKPEAFVASGFNFAELPKNAKIDSISVEYKWEQVSYSHSDIKFYGEFQEPNISLALKDKILTTIKGAIPEANRYADNTVNQAKINTNNAELATLHSHKINLSDYNLTVGDLKNLNVKFNGAPNTSDNNVRLIMQFLRLSLSPEDYQIQPICRIYSDINHGKDTADVNETFEYTVNVKNVNKYFETTHAKIYIPNDIEIVDVAYNPRNNTYDKGTGIWTINSVKEDDVAVLTFTFKTHKAGSHKFQAQLLDNLDSIRQTAESVIDIVPASITFDLKVNKNTFKANLKSTLQIHATLIRSQKAPKTETIAINTNKLITGSKGQWKTDIKGVDLTETKPGQWEIRGIDWQKDTGPYRLNIYGTVDMDTVGHYIIAAGYQEDGEAYILKTEDIDVIGDLLSKEYFKLRVEDGTDIKYNSLTFTEGDDLVNPLTYEIEDDNTLLDNLIITGETRRLPTNEAKYIKFKLKLDTDKEMSFKNVLAMIQGDNGEELVDIVLGADDSITFFESDSNRKYCVIDEINSTEEKIINLVVESDVEQTCDLKLIIFGEDKYEETNTKWKPARITFSDIPNIKLSIEGTTNDLTIDDINQGEFTLNYIVENLSDVYTGSDFKFKIEEPIYFKRLSYECESDATFNTNTRIWKINKLQDNKKHKLSITYKAQRKGIYKFILKTFDDANDLDDDQSYNEFIYNMMININNITDIYTSVSKNNPYYKELIDFNINVKNYVKKQNNFNFEISDIGKYNLLHEKSDYIIEYIKNSTGVFTPNNEDNNILGVWHIDEMDINDEANLTLTLRPIDIGTHVIHTNFTDNEINEQSFDDKVNVFEANHKIDFNISHAIYEGEEECPLCKDLIPICDEDFINLYDDIYYLFTITNNEKSVLNNLITYARIPDELLQIKSDGKNITSNIKCYPHNDDVNMTIDTSTGLLYFYINKIDTCDTKTFCIKISPPEDGFIIGEYISYFGLSMRNARVKTKQLFLTVDNTYTDKKLEHEITIYNFEKTHRYFRYEIDGTGNLFKYFNKGDKTIRSIDMEDYDVNAIEKYRGTNLRQIYRDIKHNSKYVEPELLRIGSNALADRGYEMCPDGFIRRFGLLNSEIYHYTGQLPKTTNLVDYAMKWDVDAWDTKVWAGYPYQNGVFDISVDYGKIPTNFNILEPNINPIKTLQALVDKTKPFGTKGIAYYSNTTELDMNIDLNIDNFMADSYSNLDLEIEPIFGLISWYNRHDDSIAIYNDLTQYKLETDTDIDASYNNTGNDIALEPSFTCSAIQYDKIYHKENIKECTDIIQQIYNTNNSIYGISVTKPHIREYSQITDITFNQDIELLYPIEDNETIYLRNDNDTIRIQRITDNINDFNGFKFLINNKLINQISFEETIYDGYINIEYITDINNIKILHIWCKINNKNFYHLGYYIGNINTINVDNDIYKVNEKHSITFKINDTDNIYYAKYNNIYSLGDSHKWNYLKNINTGNNQYAYFENNIEVDKECRKENLSVPKLMLKYNKPNLNHSDEIVDISIQIEAHSNKENFEKDINIDIFKDADYYLPTNNRISSLSYPNIIKNVYRIDNIPTLSLQIQGITLCSNCLHTSLGYYDNCPYCHSDQVTHFKEKQEATVCHNCGWVHDGWQNRCNHCLSKDVEKVMVDVNETYCNDCYTLSDDYYPACPNCFSTNLEHRTKKSITIDVLDNDNQNIDPIKVQSHIKRINILNIDVSLDKIVNNIDKLKKMLLKFNINNSNDGKYYYCASCDSLDTGHHQHCPYCNSPAISNYTNENTEIQCYMKYDTTVSKIYFNEGGKLDYGDNTKTIDLLDCVKEDVMSGKITLILYIENMAYDSQYEAISKLPTEEEYIKKLLNDIQKIDISIDNISIDSQYIDEKEWYNLDKFYGENHEPLTYDIPIGSNKTNFIEFKDYHFNTFKKLSNAYLYIHGLNKSNGTADLKINIIPKDNKSYPHTIENIDDSFFNKKINISNFVPLYLLDDSVRVQLQFEHVNDNSEILIYDSYIVVEKDRNDNIYLDMNENNITVYNKDDTYLFKNDNLWNLNDTLPYYLDGNQLSNGLVAYVDFGKLANDEYVRVYNINLIMKYRNKEGKFITNYLPIDLDKNEKMVTGEIVLDDSTTVIETKTCDLSISNLEYDIFNNTGVEETLSAIPLNNKIYQSFIAQDNEISKIELQYFGHTGYPDKNVTLKIYDDYNNNPNNIIAEYTVIIDSNIKRLLSFEVDCVTEEGQKYWIGLEDNSANENNYHRFRYNKNVHNGIFITEKDNITKREGNYALSYAIYSADDLSRDYTLPTSFVIDTNKKEYYTHQFKNYFTFYRNNIHGNNYLSNLKVKYGNKQEFK